MRSAFGKVNTMHNHVLPWVDRPLVTNNLVGGEDGLDDAGVSIERIIPAPKGDRKSTRLNSSHLGSSYAVFCLKKKMNKRDARRFAVHVGFLGVRHKKLR